MQFTTSFLTAVLGVLSALQIANTLPTNSASNNTANTLDKRHSYGWIAASTSKKCEGHFKGSRPQMRNTDCVVFTPKADYLAIAYGSGPISFSDAEFFADDKCTAKKILWKIEGPRGKKHPKQKGADSCWNAKLYGLDKTRSVRFVAFKK